MEQFTQILSNLEDPLDQVQIPLSDSIHITNNTEVDLSVNAQLDNSVNNDSPEVTLKIKF